MKAAYPGDDETNPNWLRIGADLQRGGHSIAELQAAPVPSILAMLEQFAVRGEAAKPGVLHPDDVKILRALALAKTTVNQYDLEGKAGLSRRTISKRLTKLRGRGLTYRPNGKHGGEAITDAGHAKIAH